METTTMTKAMAGSAVRDLCTRPWRGADTVPAATVRSVQGRTVSFAGVDARDLIVMAAADVAGDVTAPVPGVGYACLEAPPV